MPDPRFDQLHAAIEGAHGLDGLKTRADLRAFVRREFERLQRPIEPWRTVGDADQPAFEDDWQQTPTVGTRTAFAKDSSGFIHLKGLGYHLAVPDRANPSTIFTLPEDCRPTELWVFATHAVATGGGSADAQINVLPDGTVAVWNTDVASVGAGAVRIYLDGFTWRPV